MTEQTKTSPTSPTPAPAVMPAQEPAKPSQDKPTDTPKS